MGGRREGETKRVPCLKRPAHRPLKGVTGVCEGKNEFSYNYHLQSPSW